jgi:shikimate kinase
MSNNNGVAFPIILIGPIGAGKSTQGQLLSEALGVPRYAMDDLRWTYYNEIGYSQEEAKRRGEEGGGFEAVYRYWKPFEQHAVERIVAEHPDGVIDFGAGHSVQDDPELCNRLETALAPYPNIVLLLPSADQEESIRVLEERCKTGEWTRYFAAHPCNHALARHVVYTEGKTPEETRDEIIQRLSLPSSV